MVVGSWRPSNTKTELFNFGTQSWTTALDYPYATWVNSPALGHYDIIYVPEIKGRGSKNYTSVYFVIGGDDQGYEDGIDFVAMFNGTFNDRWSKAGYLLNHRRVKFCSFIKFNHLSNLRNIALYGQDLI